MATVPTQRGGSFKSLPTLPTLLLLFQVVVGILFSLPIMTIFQRKQEDTVVSCAPNSTVVTVRASVLAGVQGHASHQHCLSEKRQNLSTMPQGWSRSAQGTWMGNSSGGYQEQNDCASQQCILTDFTKSESAKCSRSGRNLQHHLVQTFIFFFF